MSCLILFNPFAGKGEVKESAQKLAIRLGAEAKDITSISDWAAFMSGLSAEDSVILCGGDGTLNRFVNDTDGMDLPCDILYYALGTGNDFLKDIEKTPEDCPINITEYIKNLPTVEVNGKKYRFLNNVGFGIDGYCCEVGDAKKASGDTDINYTSIAIKGLLFHFNPVNAVIKVDGKEYNYKKVWLAPTMKGRFYGGGMMASPAQNRLAPDGKLSIMLFHGKGRISTLIAFPSIFKGEHIKKKNMVALHEGYNIEVSFDSPCALQIDGETILGVTSYKAYANAEVPARV